MTDETIQKDVSAQAKAETAEAAQPEQQAAEDDKPVVGFDQPQSRRERRMAEVSEKRKEQREADRKKMALINDPDLTEDEYEREQVAAESAEAEDDSEVEAAAEDDGEQREAASVEEQEDEPKEPAAIPRGFVDRGDGTPVKRLKVNGQTVELTEDEYERQLSKDLAGDQKLRLAAERERKLQERLKELEARDRQSQQPPPEQPGANAEAIDKLASEYHDAVYAGDTDAAKAKLQEILKAGRQSSTPNMDDFVAAASTRIKQEAEAERHSTSVQDGWKSLQRDYPEIAQSRRHLAYADEVVKEIVNDPENEGMSPRDIILKAAETTAEAFQLKKPEAKATTTSTDASRMERKANLKPIPKTGTQPSAGEKKPKVDMSPAAKIARMRQSRAL